MNILLVEIALSEIFVDEKVFPNSSKNHFIYEHLRYYYSKHNLLPTIEIKLCDKKFFVASGHYYFFIANDLGHKRIRAVLSRSFVNGSTTNFLRKTSVTQLDWETINQEEGNELVSYIWIVIFFEKSLNQEKKGLFNQQVLSFFRQIKLPSGFEEPKVRVKDLNYTFNDGCVEFQVYVPTEDERWYAQSISVLENFHHNCTSIASFQGRRFHHQRSTDL